ncbi:Uncharacterized protein dnl_62730 [Desulfonema limicola]|uniref:Uncharacterized protein n=1 Tax=Desulfonema limicola TaxID=45656 RepID=A0A975BEI8_9BACT|nr:Uncharacterized protein dnl_62730 [Desulfonema limicola]
MRCVLLYDREIVDSVNEIKKLCFALIADFYMYITVSGQTLCRKSQSRTENSFKGGEKDYR